MKAAVYIMSCDKTADILRHCIKGLKRYWPDCSFDVYIGSNGNETFREIDGSIGLKVLSSTWKNESIDQIRSIHQHDSRVTHLIVILDDFILRSMVDNESLIELTNAAMQAGLKYTRLKVLEEGFVMKFLQRFRKAVYLNGHRVFEIRKNHPFYSSLQVALWDMEYLMKMIENAGDIWKFESMRIDGTIHYSVLKTAIDYRHIVQKSRWEIYARKYCQKHIDYFEPGTRAFRPENFLNRISFNLTTLKFFLFGYLLRNIKGFLKSRKAAHGNK